MEIKKPKWLDKNNKQTYIVTFGPIPESEALKLVEAVITVIKTVAPVEQVTVPRTTGKTKDYVTFLKYEMTYDQYIELKNYCAAINLEFVIGQNTQPQSDEKKPDEVPEEKKA